MKLPFELQEKEEVLVFTRRHWMYLYPRLALMILGAVVPIVAAVIIAQKTVGYGDLAGKIVLGIIVVWGIYWAIRIYFRLYEYNHDIWAVTNQRIVDAVSKNWFHHEIASADLVDVEDIDVRKNGLFATAFNFGDVACQTAAEQPRFILRGIPVPTTVLQTIDAARDAARRRFGARPGDD